LRYFLTLASATCVIAVEGDHLAGFVLSEENPPLAHIITLDVAEKQRWNGVGTALLRQLESNLSARGVRSVLLERQWTMRQRLLLAGHGYRIEATLKRYYLGRLDAYEMRKLFAAASV